jgi:hypothetical protein
MDFGGLEVSNLYLVANPPISSKPCMMPYAAHGDSFVTSAEKPSPPPPPPSSIISIYYTQATLTLSAVANEQASRPEGPPLHLPRILEWERQPQSRRSS